MQKFNGQFIVIADPIRNKAEHAKTDTRGWLKQEISKKNVVYTSLLPGPETEAAEIALNLKIPYIAVIPYKDKYKRWPRSVQNKYLRLLKKSVRVVYVDRELEYISDLYPPDKPGTGKTTDQVRWLVSKIHAYPGITHIVTYISGFHSLKARALEGLLNDSSLSGKWHLTQRTHLQIIDPDDDDLPF